ncbi:MAG TPA: PAS domain S-box protein [Candidatus Nanopelagicaceae bacterium]|nr:PAS domain S-box protein [Candidatus Nanopelagicaceae bacterium]
MVKIEYNKDEVREKYKELFEHSLDLIYVNDLNGNFLDASDLTLITLGMDKEEVPNISFIDLLDRENLNKAYRVTKEIRKTGKQSAQSEYKLKTKMGNSIYIETYGIPLKKDGEIYAILGVAKNITERKKAEKKLKESADMFKALFKEGSIPAYTWKNVDGDFVLINYNNAAAKTTNGNVENFLGNKGSEMYKDRLDILNDLNLCLNNKTHVRREINYRFQFSNEEKYLLVNYSYVYPDLIVVRTEDITERKKAEERLKESEIKYRNMIKDLDLGFYQVALDGIMLDHNPAHNKILGYDLSESLIGKKVTDFWQFPEDREQYLEQILRDNYVKNYICPSITKNGKKVVVQLNSHLMLDKKGNPYGIEGTFIDITEKYKLEEKLRESERLYHNLYDNTPFSVVLINTQGVVVDMNPKFKEMFGYDRHEVIGKKFMNLSIIHQDNLPNLLAVFRKFVKGEKLHRMDIKINKKDGVVFWANLQAALTKIKDKTYVQALLTDVTAKKEAEFLIEKEVIKLKELDQIRKNLISRVSHELKTPLVSVSGGCELLLTIYGEQLNKEELEIIELIEKGGKRLKHLVDNLIDISRIDYEKFKILKKPNDLSAIIREISKELNYSIKDRKINLMLLLPESFQINLDRVRFEQVIMNLLSNSIKNTPPNGEIVIKLIKKENFAEFSIHDTGIGISPEEMDMLFTKFGKLERYGEEYEYIDIQGTGLGLYISKEIVDSHEGEIRAESEGRNKGSTFIVRLPIT